MQVAITVTRTMTTMATAVMDTDLRVICAAYGYGTYRTGHMRVHTVFGVVTSSVRTAVQPTTKTAHL